MIKAVIFDYNGVIIDDLEVQILAFQKICQEMQVDLSRENFQKLCLGKTSRQALKAVRDHFQLGEINIEDVLEKKRQYYFALLRENTKAIPGVLDLIKQLSGQFQLAVTSSATQSWIKHFFAEHNLQEYFSVIVTAEDVQRVKPDPEPYVLTAQKLSLQSKDCLVIEDSDIGIQAAKAAGMFCIAITTSRSRKELQKADLVINSFSELSTEFIQNNF